jgi:hypothetical protein
MSYRVRIIISEADGNVLHEHSVEGTGDYRRIPELIDKATGEVRLYLMQVGSYSIVNTGLAAEVARLRNTLDWIEAEPEDPIKVQLWARAALGEAE